MIAQPIDLAPYLAQIEHINQARNEAPYVAQLHNCRDFALGKWGDLLALGLPAQVAIVRTERGEAHAVAEVRGNLKGHPVTIVLDNRYTWTQTRGELERFGYQWLQEVGQ
jgi:predicted transglutaminase-like cysteine proteinase